MDKESIKRRIKSLERQHDELAKYLPYADGPAYYNDKREMERISTQIRILRKEVNNDESVSD